MPVIFYQPQLIAIKELDGFYRVWLYDNTFNIVQALNWYKNPSRRHVEINALSPAFVSRFVYAHTAVTR